MKGHRLSFVVAFLVAACSSKKSERVITSTKTAVSADIVHWSGDQWTDRGKVHIEALSVVVHRSLEVSVGTDCSVAEHKTPALSLDPKADRVAYRCGPGTGWRVFDLRKKSKEVFRRCTPITGDALDWDRVPTFEQARVSLMGCSVTDATAGMAQSFASLVDESRARGGAGGVADLLGESLGARVVGGTDANGTDEWDRAFAGLSANERRPLQPRFRAAIEAGTELTAVRRALLHGDASDLLDAMERAGRKIAVEPPTTDIETSRERTRALEVIVRTLLSKRPAVAADIACEAASRFAANGLSLGLPREQLAAIALSKKSCSLDGVFERSVCKPSFGCCGKSFVCADSVRQPCKPADLDALVKLEMAQPPAAAWPGNKNAGFGDELLVAAAVVQTSSPAAQRFLERVKKVPTCAP